MTPRHLYLLLAALVAVVTLLVFQGARHNGFHFDDYLNIVDHPPARVFRFDPAAFLRAGLEAKSPRRPLPGVTFAVDWWRGQGEPGAFLVTNVVIHASNALLAFLLIARVLAIACPGAGGRRIAFAAALAALAWALHPIQVQGVTYVVQRMASMASLFMLLALVAWLQARTAARWRGAWAALAALALVAGALCKENAWIAPLLLVLTEYTLVRSREPLRRGTLDVLLWALIGAAALALAVDLASGQGPLARWLADGYARRDFTMAERLLTQPRVLGFYLSLYLLPLPGRFSLEHDFVTSTGLLAPPSTAIAIAALAAWLALGAWLALRRETRAYGWCLLLPPLALAVESGPVALEMVFEHRMYFPAIGLVALLALAALEWTRRRPALGAPLALAAALACAGLAWASLERLPVWRTQLGLYRDALEHAPGSARVWGSLALYHQREGQTGDALAAYDRAIALDGRAIELFVNRAALLIGLGRLRAAVADLERAALLDPMDVGVWMNLGALRWRGGDAAGALAALDRAVRIAPEHADAWFNRALVHGRRDAHAAAQADYRRTLALEPRHVGALVNLAVLLRAGARNAEALGLLDRAVAAAPRDPDARYLRADTLLRMGAAERALPDLDLVLDIHPEDHQARLLRATVLERLGRRERAAADLRTACDGGYARACEALRRPP